MVTGSATCDDAMASPSTPIRVGFALRKEKARKHVRAELIEEAQARGITIIMIDEHLPLEAQGPFDVILQKIRRKEFERELEDYKRRHPEVHLCDPPAATMVRIDGASPVVLTVHFPASIIPSLALHARSLAIQLLRNRKSVLDVVPRNGFAFDSEGYHCTVPNHVVLEEGITFIEAQARVDEAGLEFPFLAKSLWADGRAGSHDIAVVWSIEGLERLCQCEDRHGLPVLLEQYVDHGECMFKVYVLGNQQVICTRPSLHLDLDCRAEPSSREPLQFVNRVSAYPSSQTWGNAFLAPEKHGVPTPPEAVWSGVARKLQERTGLSLFNFDLIVPRAASGKFVMLIDVNYYPVRTEPPSRILLSAYSPRRSPARPLARASRSCQTAAACSSDL